MKNKTNNKVVGNTNKLAMVLGLGGLTGAVSMASLAGLFKPENAFMLAVLFMAGPGAIITAILLDGTAKERMFAALLAGVIATIIVILAAGVGTSLLSFLNLNVLKIAGGISVLIIGLIIMGFGINSNIPLAITVIGIILGVVLK